jgi:hypothetical protein
MHVVQRHPLLRLEVLRWVGRSTGIRADGSALRGLGRLYRNRAIEAVNLGHHALLGEGRRGEDGKKCGASQTDPCDCHFWAASIAAQRAADFGAQLAATLAARRCCTLSEIEGDRAERADRAMLLRVPATWWLGLRSSRLIAAIPVRFQNFVASNRGQNLLSHFGEAGTAILAVKQVEYGHDRTLAWSSPLTSASITTFKINIGLIFWPRCEPVHISECFIKVAPSNGSLAARRCTSSEIETGLAWPPGQSFNLEWGRGPFGPPRKEAGSSFWELEVQPLQQSETQQAVENQEQRHDEVEESRHDQDQNARNERHDRRDVGDRQKMHLKALRDSDRAKSIRARIIVGEMAEWEARRKARHLDELDFGHANQFQWSARSSGGCAKMRRKADAL